MTIVKRKFTPSTTLSEEFDSGSGACSIEFFMASKDAFCVGSVNKTAVLWLFDRTRSTDEADSIVDAIRGDYEKVLRDCCIVLHQESVQCLAPKDSGHFRDILIIHTLDLDSREWIGAATLIQELLDKEARQRKSILKISVEIRNDEKMYRDTSSAVKSNTAEYQAFMQIESKVNEQVKKTCASQWTTISYHMRGTSYQENDRKPTILITLAEGARNFWDTIESQIAAACDFSSSSGIKIYIELLSGHPQLLISKEMEPSKPIIQWQFPDKPVHGASIGARGAEKEAGSLGTWVYFQPSGRFAQRVKCFLTCYHVIAPGDPLNRSDNDNYGIGHKGRGVGAPIRVDYPTLIDVKPTRECLRSEIAKGRDTTGSGAESLRIIKSYHAAGGVGSVIYASGNRKNTKDRCMDWALVKLHNQSVFQQNVPPLKSRISPVFLNNQKYELAPNEVVTKVGELSKDAWVVKIGRTSGVTTGDVNSMRSTVKWANGMETKEMQIESFVGGGSWVMFGDSGAMVFNVDREWVGIAIGKVSGGDFGYVTPAKDIMDDIKDTTGGTISLA